MTGRHDSNDGSPRSDRLIDDALGHDREALRRGRSHDATRSAAALLAATSAAGAGGMEGLAAKGLFTKSLGAKIAAGLMAAGAGTAIVLTALPSTENEGGHTVDRNAISAPASEFTAPHLPSSESEAPAASSGDARANEADDDLRAIGPDVESRRRVAPSIVSPQQPEVVSTEADKTATPPERKVRQSRDVTLPFTINDGSVGREKGEGRRE